MQQFQAMCADSRDELFPSHFCLHSHEVWSIVSHDNFSLCLTTEQSVIWCIFYLICALGQCNSTCLFLKKKKTMKTLLSISVFKQQGVITCPFTTYQWIPQLVLNIIYASVKYQNTNIWTHFLCQFIWHYIAETGYMS